MPNPLFDQGPYDSSTYLAADQSTWPQITNPPGAVYYQPGMWWLSTGTGTVDGQPADLDDYIFVVYRPREYGELLYGEGNYGSLRQSNWTIDDIGFYVWDASQPPEYQPPFPYSGCPFGDFEGWRIVIDALFVSQTGARTYGTLDFGDEVYGGTGGVGTFAWADITRPGYLVNVNVGTGDGAQTVDVTQISIELHDDEGEWFDFAAPERYTMPFVGNPIRVGFLDPVLAYHPVAVGTIETIRDEHDTLPRYVTVEGFDHLSDLVNTVANWQRPAEQLTARIPALVAAGGWRYNALNLTWPPGDIALLADTDPHEIVVRDELDRNAASAGWMFDTDKWGVLRVRTWPLTPTVPPLVATDCVDEAPPGALGSPMIAFVADKSQIINTVIMTNTEQPPAVATANEPTSVAKYGQLSEGLGFPRSGLSFATPSQPLVDRLRDRFANIIIHAEDVTGDTLVDRNWLKPLIDLDTGTGIRTDRRGIRPFVLDGVVVGFDHTITPGRIETAIHTATTTPTF